MSSVTTPPNNAAMATACQGLLRTYSSARSASDSATSSASTAVAASLRLGLVQRLGDALADGLGGLTAFSPSERSSDSA